MNSRQKLSSIALVLSTFAGLAAALLLVGREARLVDVITLFATGFGSGAALIALLHTRTTPRKPDQAAPDAEEGDRRIEIEVATPKQSQ